MSFLTSMSPIQKYVSVGAALVIAALLAFAGVQTYRLSNRTHELSLANTEITNLKDDIKEKDKTHARIVAALEAKQKQKDEGNAFLKNQAAASAAERKTGDGPLSSGARNALGRLRSYATKP